MQKLLERNIASVEQRLVLLAPPHTAISPYFQNVSVDPARHQEFIRAAQRLRGSVYVRDGAVQPHELSPEGLHRTPEDERSWHLLMLNRQQDVSACVWYLEHENTTTVNRLRVRACPLARLDEWRDRLHAAVESELSRARREDLRYSEVGGWAVAPECRCTSEGLLLALAAYSMGRIAGGALGITTATVRHSSSTILRRLGGSHLAAAGQAVPSYFDARYNCEMELLRFDSRRPSAKYSGCIELLHRKLANVLVVAATAARGELTPVVGEVRAAA
jgi:hypothetical protein